MLNVPFGRYLIAILVAIALLAQGTIVVAGTTGTLSGTVTSSATGAPIAGAKVTAASPSQIATQTTDGAGHFSFLNLAPDTYTVSVERGGFEPESTSGVTIVSDNTRVLGLTLAKELKTIGRVTTRSATSLVRPGTTADVYSVNSAQQAKVAAAGGGGNLDSAFSALSTVPGVSILPGQAGYVGAAPSLSIRGGDYDQIGYQLDGIPVNRAFDNYPSGSTSSLGQQELQVYTGAPPAGSASEGISGYINQVVKTGTSPGFVSSDIAIGSPYYHKFNLEFGGVTPNKRLSYYVGAGGYTQTQRYVNQFDGADLAQYGYPYGTPCSSTISAAVTPSCYPDGKFAPAGNILLSQTAFSQSQVLDRDTIGNLHYYFPHKDGSRDDVQFLYDNANLSTQVYSSVNDLGGIAFNNAINGGPTTYTDGYTLNLPTGGFLPTNYQKSAGLYLFPNSPAHAFGGAIAPDVRDGFNNNQAIEKVQFTKSLGSNAFGRIYAYNNYSDWLIAGPNSAYVPYGAEPGDYELSSHTHGFGFQFSDQLGSKNLLTLSGDYVNSSTLRANNTQFYNGLYGPNTVNTRTAVGVLVDSSNPTNGICYAASGTPAPCFSSPTGYNALTSKNPGGVQFATIQQAYNGTVAPITAASCGAGPCQYLVVGNGQYVTYNAVKPTFYGAALTDEFRPTSKLTIDAGLRLDVYQYAGGDTSGGNARAFWYSAFNREMCESTTTQLLTSKKQLGIDSGTACPSGFQGVNFTNPSGSVTQTYPEFQPRVGFTYSVTPETVFRASYGRFTQPPTSAFEQYDFKQSNAPSTLYGTFGFQQYGFTTPNHPIPPAASNNYDFSIEQQFPDQISVKVSPFLRKTQNQIQNFYLNRATSFVSGLNVGNQTSSGIEFELDKGDFSREGLSAKLSFAYTHSYIQYNGLSNGSTVLTPVVNGIKTYNSFTKAGGGAPCYTTTGTADATCAAGSIANPYYNAPAQDPNAFSGTGKYTTYDTIPAGIGVSSTQFGVPYVASLVLNEKIKRFSIAPIVQLFAGQRYGSPLATNGIDPTTCGAALAGTTAGDPRYAFGAAGGSPFDAASCGQLTAGIPNVASGKFDGLGAYVQPSQLLLNFQVGYEATKNLSFTANLTNVVNTCFGGSNVPWKVGGACSYGLVQNGLTGAIGNTFNPGDGIQPSEKSAYQPYFGQQPFGVYVNANVKL